MVVSFIFVSPHYKFPRNIIGWIIRFFTKSKFSHVAIGFEDCIIEAVAPRVRVSPIDIYDKETTREIISFVVSDEMYKEMSENAHWQLRKIYGIDDCFIGGLHDLLNIHLSGIDVVDTLNCSSLGSIIARTLFPELLQGLSSSEITQETLYKALKGVPKQ